MTTAWFKYLVYASLASLAIALYRADYLRIPHIHSTVPMILSFLCLFAGFLGTGASWNATLKEAGHRGNFRQCVSGVGLTIFGKYIPGKVWMVMGRAAYVAEREGASLGSLSMISLNAQFVALWSGILLGSIGLILSEGLHMWGGLVFLLWLVLTVVVFTRAGHDTVERLVRYFLGRAIKIPTLSRWSTVTVIPWFLGYWFIWSLAFYLLLLSLTDTTVPWITGLGFPLAGTLGIISVVTPGGLGTREAVLVGYLNHVGIPLPEATTIAVASRLWFLLGEIFIFVLGWILHHGNKARGVDGTGLP